MKQFLSALTIAAVAVLSHSADAATVRVPADHSTIQSAVDAAGAGDTILVAAGEYQENVTIKAKENLTLIGEQGAEQTIIDGSQAGNCMRVEECEGMITIMGFTMQRGLATIVEEGLPTTDGGGLVCRFTSTHVSFCRFLDNEADNEGGGVAFQQCTDFSLRNSVLERNKGLASSAIQVVGGKGELIGNTLQNNDGALTVAISFAGVRVEDNVMVRNTSSSFGTIGYLLSLGGTVAGNTIAYNIGTAGSGALLAKGGDLAIERNIISNNTDLFGTSIESSDGLIRLKDNNFWENDAGSYTGLSKEIDTDISVDPGFCNPKRDDFRLRADSPCLPEGDRGRIGALPQGC